MTILTIANQKGWVGKATDKSIGASFSMTARTMWFLDARRKDEPNGEHEQALEESVE